jgi:hypothetical protein
VKVKLNAGAELDLITAAEVRKELDHARASWIGEVSRGVRARRFSFTGDSDAAGALLMGNAGDPVGPDQGMVWLLRRLSITNYNPAGADVLALYHGDNQGSAVIVPKLATWQTDMDEILMPGDRLVVAGTVAVSTRVWVTGMVKEAPAALLWRL